MGDRLEYLKSARERLRDLHEGGDDEFLVSPIYETDPVGCAPGTEAFLNAVIQLKLDREPEDILDLTQAIECSLGRPGQRPRNAPRTIDLDLLYCGETTMETERLILPHPRLSERRFVLVPLLNLGRSIPGFETLDAILPQLPPDEAEPRLFAKHW